MPSYLVATFNYPYEQAVAEQYLVPYRVLDAQASFQISGIHGEWLFSPLQQQIAEQGIQIEEIQFEGIGIERKVINIGINKAMIRDFFPRFSGNLP